MVEYQITFARSARKELQSLPVALVQRIFPKIEALSRNPHPRGCRKLKGESHLYRIRVGDYRIIYALYEDDFLVDIIAVRHRGAAYG